MECDTLVLYLSDYIDNDLDEDLTAEAEEHLRTCENCRVVLDSTQKMILLYRAQGKRRIPAARRERLFGQLEAAFAHRDDHPVGVSER